METDKCIGGMDMVLYFSKINISSTELFNVYNDKNHLLELRKVLSEALKDEAEYTVEDCYFDAAKQKHDISTIYKMRIRKRTDEYIYGVIYKNARIYSKIENKSTGNIEAKIVPTIEDVYFYFDVTKEIVGFHTRNRFGYNEFNIVFENILNSGIKALKQDFACEISLYTEGVNISEIEQKLKSMGNIKQLIFNYKIPNPSDDFLLDELSKGLDNTVEELEDANAHGMSVIFNSDGKIGLNIESNQIQNNIRRIDRLHSRVSDKKATKNGYASVRAIGKNGEIYSTEEEKPIKRIIEHEWEFLDGCVDTIKSIFSKG